MMSGDLVSQEHEMVFIFSFFFSPWGNLTGFMFLIFTFTCFLPSSHLLFLLRPSESSAGKTEPYVILKVGLAESPSTRTELNKLVPVIMQLQVGSWEVAIGNKDVVSSCHEQTPPMVITSSSRGLNFNFQFCNRPSVLMLLFRCPPVLNWTN